MFLLSQFPSSMESIYVFKLGTLLFSLKCY
jgi:hypothetical protein